VGVATFFATELKVSDLTLKTWKSQIEILKYIRDIRIFCVEGLLILCEFDRSGNTATKRFSRQPKKLP
jgi:hypothetical protein